jgi:hypothetical protein
MRLYQKTHFCRCRFYVIRLAIYPSRDVIPLCGVKIRVYSYINCMRLALLFLLAFSAVSTAHAQADPQPIAETIQLGTRIVRAPGADALQLRVIMPPELMIYAGNKLSIRLLTGPIQQSVHPAPTRVRMVDGSTHLVHQGSVTLNAFFPSGSLVCGQTYSGRLLVQGCTTRICFAPEAIPFTAVSSC